MAIKQIKKPVCPECESTEVRTNITGFRRCRRCGYFWDPKGKKKGEIYVQKN